MFVHAIVTVVVAHNSQPVFSVLASNQCFRRTQNKSDPMSPLAVYWAQNTN